MDSIHENKAQDRVLDRIRDRSYGVFGRITDRDRRRPYPWYWVQTPAGELFVKERQHPSIDMELDLRVNGVQHAGFTVRDDNDVRGIADEYSTRIDHLDDRDSDIVYVTIANGTDTD